MPYPTPPAPRIAYDDPSIASVFLDRSAISAYSGNDNIWVDAHTPGIKAMNAGTGFAVAPTHDRPYSGYAITLPYQAVWSAIDQDACIMNIVFQTPFTIKGIEMIVSHLAYNSVNPVDVKLYSVDVGQDPFGIVTNYHGILARPTYTVIWQQGSNLNAFPETIMADFPVPPFSYAGPQNFNLWVDSPLTVQALDLYNKVALKFVWTAGRQSYPGGSGPTEQYIKLHLYGYPTNNDRLGFISPTSSTILTAEELTFGDTPLGSSEDLQLRVKNYHGTQTANSIVLSAENNVGYPSPTPASQILFSSDGVNFFSTLTLPSNLPPGATSFIIHVRKVTPANAAQGQKHPRIRADVGSWT
jgi:hypothetical protein